MRVIVVSKQEAGQRLDRYLAKYMSKAAKSFFYKMLRKKNITLNGKKAAGMEKVQEGDEIKLFLSDETIDKFRGIEQTVNAPAINIKIYSIVRLFLIYDFSFAIEMKQES